MQLQRYKSFVQTNAESIWTKAACTLGASVGVAEPLTALPVFGTSWTLPCGTVPGGWTAAAQTSALDVLVVQKQLACAGKQHDVGHTLGEGDGHGVEREAKRSPDRGLPKNFLAE